jgi:hypothetical protein
MGRRIEVPTTREDEMLIVSRYSKLARWHLMAESYGGPPQRAGKRLSEERIANGDVPVTERLERLEDLIDRLGLSGRTDAYLGPRLAPRLGQQTRTQDTTKETQ